MAEFQQVDNKLLDSDDHHDVVIALTPIHYAWFKLGEYLKIPGGTLASISGMYNNDHFRQMSHLINTWISRPTREHHPSWRVLCQALADMGERDLACKIVGIEEDDQSTSKSAISSATGDATVRSRIAPTVEDLKEQLHNLTAWELFATHLPGIDQHDVTKISNEYRGIDRLKLELYTVWLDKCKNASWDHVINALEKNRLHRLVANIDEWLEKKPGRKVSSNKPKSTEAAVIQKKDIEHVPQPNGLEGTAIEHYDESTDGNGHLPELANGLEANIDWDLPSNDTATTPITIDVHNYEPKGTVKWHRQIDSAKGAGGDQCDHLVVVITNEYKGCVEGKGRLVGIKKDRKQLYKTFGGESFDLLISEDSTEQEMKETLRMTIKAIQKHGKPYKSAFIIFSGHGGMTKHKNAFIMSEDGKWVNLEKFICSFERKIGDAVPKFFLIDACRNVVLDDSAKGAGVNTLHAYATQDGEKAYMNKHTGSYWIQKVAKFFRSERGTVVKVIDKANKKVALERNQKPVIKVNTLNAEGKSLSLAHIDYESSDEEDEGNAAGAGGGSQGKSQDTLSAVKTENQSAEQTPQETNATPTGTLTKEKTPTPKTKPPPPHIVQSTSNNKLIGCLMAVIIALVGVIIAFVVAFYFSKN